MVKIKLLEPIDGFEDEAEFRPVKLGETYLDNDGHAYEASFSKDGDYYHAVVLTPCKQWRPATKQDVIDSLSGIEFPIRVRDRDSDEWLHSEYGLCGYRHDDEFPWVTSSFSWAQCEVKR